MKNKKLKTLTPELLKNLTACNQGIEFMQKYNLTNFPIDLIEEINGDFNEYVDWIKFELPITAYVDSRNRLTKVITNTVVIKIRYSGELTYRLVAYTSRPRKKSLVILDSNDNVIYYHRRGDDKLETVYTKLNNVLYRKVNGEITFRYEYLSEDEKSFRHYNNEKMIEEVIYDDNNNLIQSFSQNTMVKWYYNDGGKLKSKTKNGIEIDKREYDSNGNIVKKSNIYGTVLYEYDDNGRIISEINKSSNKETKYVYEGEYNYKSVYVDGNIASYDKYDSNGNNVASFNYLFDNKPCYREYNEFGKLVKQIYGDEICEWEYYDNGNILSKNHKLSDGSVIYHEYLKNGALKSSTEHVIEYYDNGRLKKFDDLELPFFE